MVGAFLCLLLDVFGLAAIEGAVPFLWKGQLTRLGDLDFTLLSRFAPVRYGPSQPRC
jgi:hypothetical protein